MDQLLTLSTGATPWLSASDRTTPYDDTHFGATCFVVDIPHEIVDNGPIDLIKVSRTVDATAIAFN